MSAEEWAEEAVRERDRLRGHRFIDFINVERRYPEVTPADAFYVGQRAGQLQEEERARRYAAGGFRYDNQDWFRAVGRVLREQPDLLGEEPSDEIKELLR